MVARADGGDPHFLFFPPDASYGDTGGLFWIGTTQPSIFY
jgi:hypothetical protein